MLNLDKIIKDYYGIGENITVPYSKKLTNGKEVNISKYSGLVSVVKRRNLKKIAEEWSKKINKIEKRKIVLDNCHEVKTFFKLWYKESKKYKSELIL